MEIGRKDDGCSKNRSCITSSSGLIDSGFGLSYFKEGFQHLLQK